MPIYEYKCQSCDQHIEKIQKFSDPPLTQCEACGGPLIKVFSPPGLVFKGSGWYITDYSRKTKEKEKPTAGADKPSTGGKPAEKSKDSGPTATNSSPSVSSPPPKSSPSSKKGTSNE